MLITQVTTILSPPHTQLLPSPLLQAKPNYSDHLTITYKFKAMITLSILKPTKHIVACFVLFLFACPQAGIAEISTQIIHDGKDNIQIQGNNTTITIQSSDHASMTSGMVSYHTNSLENHDFLFTGSKWKFTTDPSGEDISGKFGKRGIVPQTQFTTEYPVLAANWIKIGANYFNEGSLSQYIDKLYLEIIKRYPIKDDMFLNTWLPFVEPHKYKVEVNSFKSIYLITDDLIEITDNSTEHFTLLVEGNNSVLNSIIEFRIIGEIHDGRGKRQEVISDKSYFLAFISPNVY